MESALEKKNAESIEQKNEIASLQSSLEVANKKPIAVKGWFGSESNALKAA